MANNNNWSSSGVLPLYTTGGNGNQTPKQGDSKPAKTNNSSPCMYQGWSVHGIRCFNELFDLVKKERATQLGRDWEEAFLEQMQEKKGPEKKRKGHLSNMKNADMNYG